MHITARLGLILACAILPAHAQDAAFVRANAVPAATLADYRGGFTTDSGLAVTLGLERIVTINGNVAEQSKIEFGDLGRLASGQSTLAADAVGQLRLIQNGAGSTVAVDFGSKALAGTVIQNTLNDQRISNQTIINASVDARGLLQAMNFQSSLANALTSAAIRR